MVLSKKDKYVLFTYDPAIINNINDFKTLEKIKIKMFHIGKKVNDGVSYGLDEDKINFKLPATDTGGLTNVTYNIKEKKWSHREILFFEYIKNPIQDYILNDIFNIWENLSNKIFKKHLKNDLKKWIISRPNNFQIGIARIYSKKCIIIPAKEIKNKFNIYMFKNYTGNNEQYAYITNDIANLYCKLADNKIIPNINQSNMDIEYKLI